MNAILLDLRYALRVLRKTPGFTLTVVLTLAIGIGANTAIFGIVNALLLRPLPFAEPDRIAYLSESSPSLRERYLGVSLPDFNDWAAETRSFTGMAAFYDVPVDLSRDGDPERISAAVVSPHTFAMLGVRPVLGRSFVAEEGVRGNHRVVVLGERIWRGRFGGDRAILGRQVSINRNLFTVVGVMPEGMRFPEYAELWVPLAPDPAAVKRDNRGLQVVARLRPGVTLEQAGAELARVQQRIARANPSTSEGTGVTVEPLHRYYRGEVGSAMVVFLGVTLFVLLIACVNVGNLLLARAVARRRELAVRAALGAGQGRLVRQLLTEGVVLALAGAAGGVALGETGRRALLAAIPVEPPFWVRFGYDARTLGFVLLLTVASVLLFGLAPALHSARADLQGDLRDGGTRATRDRGRRRLQDAFVVLEVALAIVLMVGAAMTSRGLVNLSRIDPGFEPRGVATLQLFIPARTYATSEARNVFWGQLLERVRATPGVRSAGLTTTLPLSGGATTASVVAEGQAAGRGTTVDVGTISPGLLETLGVRVVRGRAPAESDLAPGTRVAVINQQLARALFGPADPLGRRIRAGDGDSAWVTVVGVARDVVAGKLGEAPRAGAWLLYPPTAPISATLVVRGVAPAALVGAVRRAIAQVDPLLPVAKVETMEQVVRKATWQPRLYAWLLGIFGGVALLLAAIGVYGVLAYSVRQQTRDIGVRRAIGASDGHVLRLVVGQAMLRAALGAAIGLLAAAALTRTLAGFVYGVRPLDPVVFTVVPLVLLVVAGVASLIPALRATRIDPIVALSQE
jgi:putative ABC transport system permease protein